MSRVSPTQASFNGGAISQRLSARADQAIYGISVEQMTGWAPMVEGAAEAMPGFFRVAQAPGPCRLLRFEFNVTQGHVIEASDLLFRLYTNDALLLDGPNPVEVVSPYSYVQVQALTTHQSYDVLYCFHRDVQTRQFVRNAATDFAFELLALENGPFDPRNKDKTLRVSSSGLTGAVTLQSTAAMFAATDVGSLFKMEAEDFGDITAWEPYITVTNGQLLTFNERVYRVIGGSGRTGSLQPVHTEGVEWDGIGSGTDINSKPAAGVQLEFIHDRMGILEITAFTSATEVAATVLRHLPFSSVGTAPGAGNYTYLGGYYDGWADYVPPAPAVDYDYGTWRWSFGAFSDTRGWPQAGCVWNERLILCKDTTAYGSVAGDLTNFATLNELGTVTNDMAFTVTISDPNPILHAVSDDKLLLLTASGVHALGPSNAASGVGPNNYRVDRQNDAGGSAPEPVRLDSRTLHIGKNLRRIFETDFDAQRQVESEVDLTRYARQIGNPKFGALASQQHPFNLVWAQREDGTLAAAAYNPAEEVLGWAERPLATGLAARSLASITDPLGEDEQVWIAAEYGGDWHVLRMAEWRRDGESDDTACLLDMADAYDGAPATAFSIPWLASTAIQVVADGRVYLSITTDGTGAFTLPVAAARVVAGLPFDAGITGLPIAAGGDDGEGLGKMGRIGRAMVKVAGSRGLAFGTPGNLKKLEAQTNVSPLDTGFANSTAIHLVECAGDSGRESRLRIERQAPTQATLLWWKPTIEVQSK